MNKKALFIGLTTVDIQFVTDVYPKPNQKIKTNMPHIVSGGPAANAAITYSFLGGKVDFLTCIGNHIFSDVIVEDFKKHSVNVIDAIASINADPIVSAVITTTSNGDRTIFTHHPEKMDVSEKCDHVLSNISDYDLIFTDGFYPELFLKIGMEAKNLGKPVVFDGGSWKPHLYKILPYVDVAICSSNFHPPKCRTNNDIFAFLEENGVSKMAITRGGESILLPNNEIDISAINVSDTLGAGDVLHGAFCFSYLQNNGFEKSIEFGSRVASFSAQHIGTRMWMKFYK